jgi:hypothetical protein
MEVQGNDVFFGGFLYDDLGNPVWYVTRGTLSDPSTYSGNWQLYAGGQTITGGYRTPVLANANVGAVTTRFPSSQTGGSLTLPNNTVVPLQRFDFAGLPPGNTTAQTLFDKLARGVWLADGSPEPIPFRFSRNGGFMMGQYGAAQGGGRTGVEYGSVSWDPQTQRVQFTRSIDTNGQWGTSHPRGTSTLTVSADGRVVTVVDSVDGPATLRQMDNDPTGIVGAWAVSDPVLLKTVHILFLANGKYVMLDPLGDTDASPTKPSCGGPGVEGGTYTTSGPTTHFTLTITVRFDSNGCAGINDRTTLPATEVIPGMSISPDGKVLRFTEFEMYRVSTNLPAASSAARR